MLKKTISYIDYNGVERSEDFYFNLTKAELVEMEYSVAGGLADSVKRIISAQDAPTIMEVFKKIILKAYGEKSPDGKRFMKVDENGHLLSIAFSQTEAYSNLYMELMSDDKAALAFIQGIIPSDLKLDMSNPDIPDNLKKLLNDKND